jgi:hypothetical protein
VGNRKDKIENKDELLVLLQTHVAEAWHSVVNTRKEPRGSYSAEHRMARVEWQRRAQIQDDYIEKNYGPVVKELQAILEEQNAILADAIDFIEIFEAVDDENRELASNDNLEPEALEAMSEQTQQLPDLYEFRELLKKSISTLKSLMRNKRYRDKKRAAKAANPSSSRSR